MLSLLTDPQSWLAFLTLTVLEVVLGIDNIIFITILVLRLPAQRQRMARVMGLGLAMVTRIALLLSIVGLTRLTRPWFTVLGEPFSGRDLVLLAGGVFLLVKAVLELHHSLETKAPPLPGMAGAGRGVLLTVVQIALLDIVFSLDSVLTAVGLGQHVAIMVAAICVAVLVMLVVSKPIGAFIERNPTLKTLALSFLILVGMTLVASGLHFEIPKGYLYFAMAFSFSVELINIRVRRLLDARRKS
jgi:predicted tellurium resistance membrane protein TerC